jgi:signal transduction histidine kinase
MNWNAVPVAIMAGVMGYSAILFYGLYLALADVAEKGARREYLTFALTCLAAAAYDICCVGLYNADSLDQGVFWMRGNLLTAACIGVAYQAFVWDFLKARIPLALRIVAIVLAALGLTVAFWDSPYTFTTALPAIKHLRVFGRDIIYYEGEAGVVDQVLMLVFFAIYAVNVGYLVRYFISRAGRKHHGQLGFLIATVISGAAATNDFLVTGQVYKFLYAAEYGFAAILTAMGYVLLMRFGELHEAVNKLNRDLAGTNADLVVALEQAKESIRVKTEFLASMSHELRTPLNAIVNLPAQLAQEFQSKSRVSCSGCGAKFELDDGEVLDERATCSTCGASGLSRGLENYFIVNSDKASRWLATVTRAGENLLGLVDDVLDASKLELGRTVIVPSLFDPVALITEVIDSAQTIASKKGVKVRFEALANDASLEPIVADRTKLGQVLFNIIGNAIKFSPEDSVVEVSYAQPSPGESSICVRDHGIGIAENHHQIIFEKFRQVDAGATRTYGGTGLGLAISKSLVELHQGRIWVESVKGQGASFFVQLPPIALPESDAANTSSKEARPSLPNAV